MKGCALARALCPFYLALLLGGTALAASPATDPAPAPAPALDPVSFTVTGLAEGPLLTNVRNYLTPLTHLERSRLGLFRREILSNVRSALHTYGYYHPKVDIKVPRRNEQSGEVLVDVEPGKPLFIRQADIDVVGAGAQLVEFQKIARECTLRSYTILDHEAYKKLKADLEAAALRLGFFDFKFVSSRIITFTDLNQADIEVIFDTGPRYTFGDYVPRDEGTVALLRPAKGIKRPQPGDPFSQAELDEFTRELSRTGFYRSIDVQPVITKGTGTVPIDTFLERQSANRFRVGAGYSTDYGVGGHFAWTKPLLNERGHSLTTDFTASTVTHEASVIYKIPRHDPNHDYYYIKAAQTQTDFNDTKADTSHLSVHYVNDRDEGWQYDYSLRLEYDDFTQGVEKGHGLNLMPAVLLSRRQTSGGMDPKRGYFISLELMGGVKAITDYSFVRAEAHFKGVISPTENSRLVLRAHQGVMLGPSSRSVPPSLRFFVGGDNLVRGYGYLDVSPRKGGKLTGARYLTAASAELQVPSGIDNLRLAGFYDIGVATQDYGRIGEWISGVGTGARYITEYGIARLDLAFGISGQGGGFRLHFSFGKEF
ncbi:MAG: autotransporter assembly complex protein TamA [Succinivibrionaceae bacterium]|nr:autotransporter assembly complex protein TamA [Succinivibrionaceae bacterium]